jgi:hypothetical protein
MDKREIEQMMSRRVREAVEAAALDCIREINHAGYSFVPSDEAPLDWIDHGTDQVLSVTCALGVGLSSRSERTRPPDPVTDAFLALAESGTDRMATTLNLLEGDIANGGFTQLFDNKGLEFVREAIGCLKLIRANSTARLVGQALALVEDRTQVLADYDRLVKDLRRLDVRFIRLKENIPQLFTRYRAVSGS